jgi:hypothetical protein
MRLLRKQGNAQNSFPQSHCSAIDCRHSAQNVRAAAAQKEAPQSSHRQATHDVLLCVPGYRVVHLPEVQDS